MAQYLSGGIFLRELRRPSSPLAVCIEEGVCVGVNEIYLISNKFEFERL